MEPGLPHSNFKVDHGTSQNIKANVLVPGVAFSTCHNDNNAPSIISSGRRPEVQSKTYTVVFSYFSPNVSVVF